MQGKISMVASVSASDYEVLSVLQEHCFTITDIKLIAGNSLLLEIQTFSNPNDVNINYRGDYI